MSLTVGNFPERKEEHGHEPTPANIEKFARMLEKSSLGSEESRQARFDGARVLAEHSIMGCPWVAHASSWTDIATMHQNMADIFEAEWESDPSELWLRAALNRTANSARATQLAVLLEQRRAIKEAVVWYERAAEMGDHIAWARLAVLCELNGDRKMATLLLSLGQLQIPKDQLVEASGLAGALPKAGRRHRVKLIADCRGEDILHWAGCLLLLSGDRKAAIECYSAAMAKGHTSAMLSLYDLQMSLTSKEEDAGLADVQSLTCRLLGEIESEPCNDATIFTAKNNGGSASASVGNDRETLVSAAVNGDPVAIDEVLRWIRPLVLRYCRTRVGGQERTFTSADDVAQEVCIAVLTALPSYRDQGRPFLAFVYGIAAHKVADAHRSVARNRTELGPDVPDTTDLTDGPEAQVMNGEFAGLMAKLLESVSDKQREILHLRVVVGLSVEETAEAVGSTPGAVRVAQHRGLKQLRELLTAEPFADAQREWTAQE